MSTSLLYHAFGIRSYRYVRTDYLEGEVVFVASCLMAASAVAERRALPGKGARHPEQSESELPGRRAGGDRAFL